MCRNSDASTVRLQPGAPPSPSPSSSSSSSSSAWRDRSRDRLQGTAALVSTNLFLLCVGTAAQNLLTRLYSVGGGSSVWLWTLVQTAGFPLAGPTIGYQLRRKPGPTHHLDAPLAAASVGVGVLTAANTYLYTWGPTYLSAAAAQLCVATQLGFTAAFWALLLPRRLRLHTCAAVALLSLSMAALAAQSDHAVPAGVSHSEYVLGLLLTLASAALYGLLLPLVELTYRTGSGRRDVTYTAVVEMQAAMAAVATACLCAGLLLSGDFRRIAAEARHFRGGVAVYVACCAAMAASCEMYFVGMYGITLQVHSLFGGVAVAACFAPTQLLAAALFKQGSHAMDWAALALALLGLASYAFGQYRTCHAPAPPPAHAQEQEMDVECQSSKPSEPPEPPEPEPEPEPKPAHVPSG